jgi:hypothetical protein
VPRCHTCNLTQRMSRCMWWLVESHWMWSKALKLLPES